MKIGIIGLKPHQVADLRSRKLGGHTVEFLDEKAITRDRVQTFCGHHDRVILVAPNAPGPIMGFIPKEQRHVVRGGVSCIIRLISEWPRAEIVEAVSKPSAKLEDSLNIPPKVPARVEDVMLEDTTSTVGAVEVVTEDVAPTSNKAELRASPTVRSTLEFCVASQLPDNHRARYVKPTEGQEPAHQVKRENGSFNFTILAELPEGTIVRYPRPEGIPDKQWQQRVYSTRYSLRNQYDVLLEAHFYKTYMDFYIVKAGVGRKTKAAKVKVQPTPQVLAAEAPVKPIAPSVPMEPSVPAPAVTVKVGKVGQPVFVNDFATRHFWQEAFVAGVIQGLDANAAMVLADTALIGLQDRFGGKADESK